MSSLKNLKKELRSLSSPDRSKILRSFFKTDKGEYGEGDIFLGIGVPLQRKLAKRVFNDLELDDLRELLNENIHEERMIALLVLIEKYKNIPTERCKIFNFYIDNIERINNWDLVDLSAPKIVGSHLMNRQRKTLYTFSKSKSLWCKRISIVATFAFIKKNDFRDTLKISEILLKDEHDLIHKAVGWMLREVGKRNLEVEEDFLKRHYKNMPRTMLRYAIEKFENKKRLKYLNGKI